MATINKNLFFYSDGTVWQIVGYTPMTWNDNGERTGGIPIFEKIAQLNSCKHFTNVTIVRTK